MLMASMVVCVQTAGVSEWGKLWTINKKHIDPTAVRYNAVAPGYVACSLRALPCMRS